MEKINDRIYVDIVNGVIAVDAPTAGEAKEIALDWLRENEVPNWYGLSVGDENELYQMDIDEDEADTLLYHDEDGGLMTDLTEDLRAETVVRLLYQFLENLA